MRLYPKYVRLHPEHIRYYTEHLRHHTEHARPPIQHVRPLPKHVRPHPKQVRPEHVRPHPEHVIPHTEHMIPHTEHVIPQLELMRHHLITGWEEEAVSGEELVISVEPSIEGAVHLITAAVLLKPLIFFKNYGKFSLLNLPFSIFDFVHVHCAALLIISIQINSCYPNSFCTVTLVPVHNFLCTCTMLSPKYRVLFYSNPQGGCSG